MKKVYRHVNEILTLEGALKKDGRRLRPEDLSLLADGAIVFTDEMIEWVGPTAELPDEYQDLTFEDLTGYVLTPEIVDSHTHLVFAGDRAQEYADRLNGVSYEEIRAKGGGILKTMNQTNAEPLETMYQQAVERIKRLHSYGIGTIEIKSGYGLNFQKEYELSLLIDRLKREFSPKVQIYNTYLAAHDVPQDFSSSAEYLQQVVLPLLERLAPSGIIDAVDIFHEQNYFNEEDVRVLFTKAKELGIPRKIHADELNDNGGAKLAAELGCLSADHLLRISDEGIAALTKSSTVASLLPGTAFFLGKPLAPARKLLDAGVKVALASDYNPGSCHCDNLLLIASLSAPQLKINLAELWAGITLNAAHSLGMKHQGALVKGQRPRFTLFKSENLAQITYNWGRNLSVDLV